jgi:hypothetical protein
MHGMCSKCHREQVAELEAKEAASKALTASSEQVVVPAPPAPAAAAAAEVLPAAVPAVPATSPAAAEAKAEACCSAPTVPEAASPAAAAASGSEEAPSKPITRCQQCRKKVGLTGFKCKCGLLFCGGHRYAEDHACTYDWRSAQREKLAADNPLVRADKIQRI